MPGKICKNSTKNVDEYKGKKMFKDTIHGQWNTQFTFLQKFDILIGNNYIRKNSNPSTN